MQPKLRERSGRHRCPIPFTFPFTLLLLLPLTDGVVHAQRSGEISDTEACAVCGLGLGLITLIPIVILAIQIALLVWVARDAKSRGAEVALWLIFVFFFPVIGIIVYVLARPKGDLVQCASCRNKRLQGSAKCPHCGNP